MQRIIVNQCLKKRTTASTQPQYQQHRNSASATTTNTPYKIGSSSNQRQRIIVNPYLKKITTASTQPQPQTQPQYQQYRNSASATTTNIPLRASPTFYSPSLYNRNINNNTSKIKKTSPLQPINQNTIYTTSDDAVLSPEQTIQKKVIRNPYAHNNKSKASNSPPIINNNNDSTNNQSF